MDVDVEDALLPRTARTRALSTFPGPLLSWTSARSWARDLRNSQSKTHLLVGSGSAPLESAVAALTAADAFHKQHGPCPRRG